MTRVEEAGRDSGNGHADLRDAPVAWGSRRRAALGRKVARVEVVLAGLRQDGRPVSWDGKRAPEVEHGAGALEIDTDTVDSERGSGGVVQADRACVEAGPGPDEQGIRRVLPRGWEKAAAAQVIGVGYEDIHTRCSRRGRAGHDARSDQERSEKEQAQREAGDAPPPADPRRRGPWTSNRYSDPLVRHRDFSLSRDEMLRGG